MRYHPNGTLDNSYGVNGKVIADFFQANNYGITCAIQSDDKILIFGQSEVSPNLSATIVRFNTDGSIDETFGENGSVLISQGNYQCYGNSILLQPDGKIVVAGHAIFDQGEDFYVARFLSDGTADNSFNTNGFVADVNSISSGAYPCIALQPDGKIVLSGMGAIAGQQNYCTMRFTESGELDTNFNDDGIQLTPISGYYNFPADVVIQTDGKILIGGYSGPYQSELMSMVRYSESGNLDPNFGVNGIFTLSINPGLDKIEDLLLQPDGKILICGYTIETSLGYRYVLMRCNENGSLDTNFGVDGMIIQPFTLNEARASKMVIQSDGKLVVAGHSQASLDRRAALARYTTGIPANVISSEIMSTAFSIFPNPTTSAFRIGGFNTNASQSVVVYNSMGATQLIKTASALQPIDISFLPSGMYWVEIKSVDGKTERHCLVKTNEAH